MGDAQRFFAEVRTHMADVGERLRDTVFWDADAMGINQRTLAQAQRWAETVGRPMCPVCGDDAPDGHVSCGLALMLGVDW
jgi:hypothetical protein